MEIKDLRNEPTKYARFFVESTIAETGNDNFERLFKFIGRNSDSNKKTDEGRAYYEIRKETDKILKVSVLKNRNLKTSKAEIKALRKCFKNVANGEYTMKIPYKVEYIFRAIINIVERIEKDKGESIPSELQPVVNTCYGAAFYKKYISTYNNFEEIKEDYIRTGYGKCRYELKNDFESPTSSFSVRFK